MSQYWTILQAAKDAVTPLVPGAAVAVRKRPYVSVEHGDALPFVCISYTEERIGGLTFNDSWIDYEVNVTLFQDRGGAVADAAAQRWQLDAREAVRLALFSGSTLPGAPAVFDCVSYDPSPAFDVGGLEQAYDVSRQSFVFRNAEARS